MRTRKMIALLAMTLAFSCRGKNEDAKMNEEARKKATEKVTASTNQVLKVFVTDNKKDLVCYMPLSAGIGDTLHYKGKLYGFCSRECKKEFLRNPAAYVPK